VSWTDDKAGHAFAGQGFHSRLWQAASDRFLRQPEACVVSALSRWRSLPHGRGRGSGAALGVRSKACSQRLGDAGSLPISARFGEGPPRWRVGCTISRSSSTFWRRYRGTVRWRRSRLSSRHTCLKAEDEARIVLDPLSSVGCAFGEVANFSSAANKVAEGRARGPNSGQASRCGWGLYAERTLIGLLCI